MNNSIYRISLDIHDTSSQVSLRVKRGDTARSIYITLTENGKPYKIAEGCSANFEAKKADGNFIHNACRIEGNTIIYDLTAQTTAAVGATECEIALFDEQDKKLTSPCFTMVVEDTVYNGEEIVSTPEADALEVITNEARDVITEFETKLANGDFVGEKGDKGDKGDRGEQGIQGIQGERGEAGQSGVYLGSGDMPADCNVQIDPEGEAIGVEVIIDELFAKSQEYIDTKMSENVEDAISDLQTPEGTVVSQNADFAEVAEWADGNPDNEDRTGYFVCANVPLNGIVMKKAKSTDDVKGVSISAPAFAGNYTKDKLDSNGNLLPKYSFVAIIGFVPVIDKGRCTVGGRCMPDDDGCAIPSSNSMGYQVVSRIDDNRVLIIIEPNGDMVQRIKTKVNQIQNDSANAINGNVSGTAIAVNDVSPVEHNVGCYLTSDTITDFSGVEVSQYGKNFFNPEFTSSNQQVNYTDGILFTPQTPGNTVLCQAKPLYIPQNTWLFYKHTLLLGKDRVVIKLYNSNGENISTNDMTNIECSYTWYLDAYKGYYVDNPAKGFTFRVTSNVAYITLNYCGMNSEGGNKYGDLQLELGTTATPYKPYIEPTTYTANADGTVEGIKSLSPSMTLLTNNNGVVINCKYNIDTKAYVDNKFAELQALILEG